MKSKFPLPAKPENVWDRQTQTASSDTVGRGFTRLHPEMLVHWSDAKSCLCSHDHWIYRFDYRSQKLSKVFRIPPKSSALKGRLTDWLARSWIRRRFFPGPGIQNVVQLPSGVIVVVYDQVYWFDPALQGRWAKVWPGSVSPTLAPPLTGGIAVHAGSSNVYFGEYLNGHDCDIRLCRLNFQTQQMEVCWTFARSEIKHIHAVHYDRYRSRLWVLTGDRDHESSFYYSDDEFTTLHRFSGGDQSWRAIAVLFDETGMEWGMDAGKDAPADAINQIYRYDFAENRRSVRATIGNPAYAACEFSDGTAMMQTTFEPGRQQDTPAEAALWFRGLDRQWRQCLSLPYAPHEREGVSRYASILLPKGTSPAGQLLCTPVNCDPGHYALMDFRLVTALGRA